MKKSYIVKCLSARYDEDQGILVLACLFENVGLRLVHFNKSDFHYKNPAVGVPDCEMHKTAELFRDKRFKIIINSDPSTDLNNSKSEHDILRSAFDNENQIINAKFGDISFGV